MWDQKNIIIHKQMAEQLTFEVTIKNVTNGGAAAETSTLFV